MAYLNIKTSELELNNGQVEGLPRNPRFIKDDRFSALVKSIEDAPEMLAYRSLLVFPHNGKYVVICGNMRLRACKQIGYKEMPCYVLPEDTPVEKLREYTIKDNIGFGSDDWDMLANEWDSDELTDWGMQLPEINLLDDETTDLEENESGECSVKITFDEPQKIDEFLKAYKDELQQMYNCKIAVSGKKN